MSLEEVNLKNARLSDSEGCEEFASLASQFLTSECEEVDTLLGNIETEVLALLTSSTKKRHDNLFLSRQNVFNTDMPKAFMERDGSRKRRKQN